MYIHTGQMVLATEEIRTAYCYRNWIVFLPYSIREKPKCVRYSTDAGAQITYRWLCDHYHQEIMTGYKRLFFM